MTLPDQAAEYADDRSAVPADQGSGSIGLLGLLPEPDLQADPCSADGTQTDYYTAGTVRRLLAAERKRCADKCKRPAAWLSDAQQVVADEIRAAILSGA